MLLASFSLKKSLRERYLIGDRALICEFKPLKECHKRMFRGWKAEPFARAPRKT